jgi:hypothetical protein
MQAVFSQQQRLYYVLMVGLLACGCVQRRFVVQTNVPAQIYVNNQPIGPSPADTAWEYTGEYDLSAVAQGYAPSAVSVQHRGCAANQFDLDSLESSPNRRVARRREFAAKRSTNASPSEVSGPCQAMSIVSRS